MVRVPCCEKLEVKKGPWTPEEDHKLVTYIQTHGHSSWRALPKQAGLSRCGKSCRLRWTNYLRPGIKRGNFSPQEEHTIIQLHAVLGNRWSTISTHLSGRTDNEIKNHWNTRLRKRMLKMGLDPVTHRPWALPQQQPPLPFQAPSINTLLHSLLQSVPPSSATTQSSILNALLPGSHSSANDNGLFPSAPGHVSQSNPRAPAAPPASSAFPSPVMLDPALLAAAETRLVLDCLKYNNVENQTSTSDHQVNQLLTRLLLLKLLQSSNMQAFAPSNPSAPSNPNAGYENRDPIHNITQHAAARNSSFSADHILQSQGLHPAATLLVPAPSTRETATVAEPSSAYVNPNLYASLSDANHSNTSNTTLLSMSNSSFQQRLLQTLPFLAESVIEPCTSAAATDHLSSTSPPGTFPNCSSAEHTTPNGGLPSQQAPPWASHSEGGDDHFTAGGVIQKQSLAGEGQMLASGGQLFGGGGIMHDVAMNKGPPLMTWEEHLMSDQKVGDRDLGSSSTVSSSTLSSGSQSQAAPATPSNNFNIQEYWSNLLNLISSCK